MQKKTKKIRLGKNNIYEMDNTKGSFDTYHGQFVLTCDINYIREGNKIIKLLPFEIETVLITPDKIRGNFNYLEYKGYKTDFEYIYKKSVSIQSRQLNETGKLINVLIYNNACYMIDKAYINCDNRFFKSIEKSVLDRKYKMGACKSHKAINKAYGFRACKKQSKILGIREKSSKFVFEKTNARIWNY